MLLLRPAKNRVRGVDAKQQIRMVHSHTLGSRGFGILDIGENIFAFTPAANALLAVSIVTILTQILTACAPPLRGPPLLFLVALAGGGMLGTVFLHMIPEIDFTKESGLVLLLGFLLFVSLDKAMNLFAGDNGHTHSHLVHDDQDNQNEETHGTSSIVELKASETTQNRKVSSKTTTKSEKISQEIEKPSLESQEPSSGINIMPWLNVLADSMHNVTDGIALAISFKRSRSAGYSAFLLMCCHEIPHQFGDFALLITSGTSKSTALIAQLCTAMGTLVGCILGSNLGALHPKVEILIDKYALPFTAGVFLYVVTLGVIPEVLETRKGSFFMKLFDFIVVALGISCGLVLPLVLE